MIVSGGELVLAETTPIFAQQTYYVPGGVNLVGSHPTYGAIYRGQLWVYVVVNKLAYATARLPLKVYQRTEKGRDEARDTPYAKLLATPNPKHDAFFLKMWTQSTIGVYGEAMWMKVRGRDGVPREVWPLHPSNVFTKREESGELRYYFYAGNSVVPSYSIPEADIVHFKTYNPDSTVRGISPIEPLRQTLANEDAARRATSAFWLKGARPAVALMHPKNLSQPAADRLRAQWDAIHAGADNTGSTAVLEEGMEPRVLSLSAEEAQYIQTRVLNREEVVAAYDVPPPVVHILDHATFSNITEQMRSMYRDTMAPKLGLWESTLDQQLRPEFDKTGTLYAEFLLDEVLRGDFEVRTQANAQAIMTGQMTPAEARKMENRPFIEGSDKLFIGATLIPVDVASQHANPNPPAEYAPQPNQDTPPPPEPAQTISSSTARSVTDRAARRKSLDDIDPAALVAGLNGESQAVLDLLTNAETVPDFCRDIWNLVKES